MVLFLGDDAESRSTSVACQGPGTSGWGADVTPAVRPSLHPVIPVPSPSPGCVPVAVQSHRRGPSGLGGGDLLRGKATAPWLESFHATASASPLAWRPCPGHVESRGWHEAGQAPEQLSLRARGQQGGGRAELPPTPWRAWDTLAWSACWDGLGDTANSSCRSLGTGRRWLQGHETGGPRGISSGGQELLGKTWRRGALGRVTHCWSSVPGLPARAASPR